MPGHMNLSEYESTLSLALNSSQTISTLQNLPGSFYELLRLCAEKYDIDYIFIDMNPGLSALNQTFFISSDAFIIPTNPDPFSIMAIKTLNVILPRWKNWAENSRKFFQDASYPLPDVAMRFAGEIIQRYNKRNGEPVRAFAERIAEIKDYIENTFKNDLESKDMLFDITDLINDNIINDYCLAEIPDFLTLLPRSQKANKPVFALDDSELGSTGVVLTQDRKRRDEFKDVFNKVATIISRLVQ